MIRVALASTRRPAAPQLRSWDASRNTSRRSAALVASNSSASPFGADAIDKWDHDAEPLAREAGQMPERVRGARQRDILAGDVGGERIG
jgi:hypothetical protein